MDNDTLLISCVIAVQLPLIVLLVWLRSRKTGRARIRLSLLIYSLTVLSVAALVLVAVVIAGRPSEQKDALSRLRGMGWEVTDLTDLFGTLAVDSADAAVTEKSLEQLGRLKHVEWLIIRDPSFSDADLAALVRHASPDSFERLSLKYTEVTEDGLLHLRQLTALRCLKLEGMDIGPEETAALQQLDFLEILDLSRAQISDEDLRGLERSLPDCTIREPDSP